MPAFNSADLSSTLIANTNTTLYTVASDKCFRLTSIVITNYSLGGTPTTTWFSLMIGGTASVNLVRSQVNVQPGGSYTFAEPLLLPESTVIYAIAGVTGKLTAMVNGVLMYAP